MELKECCKCLSFKTLDQFSLDRSKKSGIRPYCKECQREYKKSYLKKYPDRVKESDRKYKEANKKENYRWDNLRQKYNLSEEDYNILLHSQDNLCKVCSKFLTYPHIDHCHKTGKIRGILCPSCNTGLGKLGDTVEGVRKALEYLEEFEKRLEQEYGN